MPVFVGCSGLPMRRNQYYDSLNAVELLLSQEVPPKPSNAQRWAEEAPEGFRFAMVAPRILSTAPDTLPPGLDGEPGDYGGLKLTEANLALYDRTLEAASAVGASAMLFVTTPQLGPSHRGREALRRFFSTIERGDLRFVWEPHGPWEGEAVAELCDELGLIRCVDPLRDEIPPAEVAYCRLGPFAVMGRHMADDELDDIVEALEPFDEAYCFFDTEHAFSDARRLAEMSEP